MDDPSKGKYCGQEVPPIIRSTSNVLLVRFYSDSSVSGAGFNATYVQEDGRFILQESKSMVSHLFPIKSRPDFLFCFKTEFCFFWAELFCIVSFFYIQNIAFSYHFYFFFYVGKIMSANPLFLIQYG